MIISTNFFLSIASIIFLFQIQVRGALIGTHCSSEPAKSVCVSTTVNSAIAKHSVNETLITLPHNAQKADYSNEINLLRTFLSKKNLLDDEKELIDRRIRIRPSYANGPLEALYKLQKINNLTKDEVTKILNEYFYNIDDEVKIVPNNEIGKDAILPKSMLHYKITIAESVDNDLPKDINMGISAVVELLKLKRHLTSDINEATYSERSLEDVNKFVNDTLNYINLGSSPKIFDRADISANSMKRHVSTLIPLPFPAIVPGDRFREVYYWDSYPIIRGLAAAGREKEIMDIIKNYFYLIDELGFIPNGAREYYLDRSQPPLFIHSVAVVYSYLASMGKKEEAKNLAIQALPRMLTEYFGFWMNPKKRHVVALEQAIQNPTEGFNDIANVIDYVKKGGRVLNRFYSDLTSPRPESHLADTALRSEIDLVKKANKSTHNINFDKIFQAIRAAAESGHDFSSRWNRRAVEGKEVDGKEGLLFFKDLDTTSILPIDLNSILYAAEMLIEKFALELLSDIPRAEELALLFKQLAEARLRTMKIMKSSIGYSDYDYIYRKPSSVKTAAQFYYYFAVNQPVPTEVINEVCSPHGCFGTLIETDQQWDHPNVWAPLQGLALGNISENWSALPTQTESRCIGERFVKNAWQLYSHQIESKQDALFVEKYNGVDTNVKAGGGEYVLQRGFGWTNGLIAELVAVCDIIL